MSNTDTDALVPASDPLQKFRGAQSFLESCWRQANANIGVDRSRAVVGPLEPSVGRLLDEGTNTSGPRGTYGCACAHHDGSMCAWIRYGGDGPEDPCECLCHGWPEDEDDYLG